MRDKTCEALLTTLLWLGKDLCWACRTFPLSFFFGFAAFLSQTFYLVRDVFLRNEYHQVSSSFCPGQSALEDKFPGSHTFESADLLAITPPSVLKVKQRTDQFIDLVTCCWLLGNCLWVTAECGSAWTLLPDSPLASYAGLISGGTWFFCQGCFTLVIICFL